MLQLSLGFVRLGLVAIPHLRMVYRAAMHAVLEVVGCSSVPALLGTVCLKEAGGRESSFKRHSTRFW